jgi:hypothetical protein
MKNIRFLLAALLVFISGCGTTTDYSQVLEDIQENLDFGNLSTVLQITDSLKKSDIKNKEFLHLADSLSQIARRINLDFPVTANQEKKQIEKLLGSVSTEQIKGWEENGWLEWRMIDGEKKYFSRAASNLLLIKKFHNNKSARFLEIAAEPGMIFRLKHTEEVLKSAKSDNLPVIPLKMKITYTITVHPDAVPEGEKIRCWMPWPKVNHPRQTGVKLLGTSQPDYLISPDTAIHSTLYMEQISKKNVPSVFRISYEYFSNAQHFNLSGAKALPYNKTSEIYQKYTSEQPPHISFTDNIRLFADSLTLNDNDPVSEVRKIYSWFKENITWTGALEYSIMPNIPEYVLTNSRGDCGMQTFLLLSMLRYKGIPVRWQSGWMMPPDNENLHDWCEVYYEGIGWVPVDVSYDLQKSEDLSLKYFYFSGIDSYRLIVNDGVAGPLHPQKEFLRSEPYDFQRGEVEWKGGNLYFDKWNYDMKIEYIK